MECPLEGALRVVDGAQGADLQAAYALRHRVFVLEQAVPLDLERDALDEGAHHVVILDGLAAIATGRVRIVTPGLAKAERVAVDKSARGRGLGRRIMDELEAAAGRLGARSVKLAAQQSAVAFYERLGYLPFGTPFMDAGIAHRWMERLL